MLAKTFEIHSEVYKYSHSVNSQTNYCLYGDSKINSCEGTLQKDPKSRVSFLESIQEPIHSLRSKKNVWYLDDGR